MENTKLHKLLLRQLHKVCNNIEEKLEKNNNFKKFINLISKTYQEYDDYAYTLERSRELSFEELETLQKEEKNSYESQLRAMVNAMPDMMFLNDEDGIFLEFFVKKEDELFFLKNKIIGKNYDEIFPPTVAKLFKKSLKKSIYSNELIIIEYELSTHHKIQYYEARLISTQHLVNNKKTVVSIVRNISKEKRTQRKLEYIATHDDLTKLPNRFYFQKHLEHLLQEAINKNRDGALFFLDIDQFKVINDNLGHDIGDKVLLKITKRLRIFLSKEIFLARFGGDEFVIILSNYSKYELHTFADALIQIFIEPFKVGKYLLNITASIGICSFPKSIDSASQLLKQADIAMYKSKELGKNSYTFFTKSLADTIYEEFSLEIKLKQAIENNAFHLLYQPQIRLYDNKLIGVEALIRWQNNGLTSPVKFIPIAEKCGYIEQITDWVLEEVCQQIVLWKKNNFEIPRVAINLSRSELAQKNLLHRIKNIIQPYFIDFSYFEFEVTETALFVNTELAFKNIKALRLEGFMIAIDDFGTGYSSFSNINESLFDKLKIDRSFIVGIGNKKESESIIKATIAMAKSLNLKVIAEGVETKEQLEFLKKYNCDEIQGYYYSRPVSPNDLLKQWS